MIGPMSQSGESQEQARERAQNNLATKIVMGCVGALAAAALTYHGTTVQELATEVSAARSELKTTRQAQGTLLAAVNELKKLVDQIRIEQAGRSGDTQRIRRLEEDAKELRARIRDAERRVGSLEGQEK